jgi:hypothetical protein
MEVDCLHPMRVLAIVVSVQLGGDVAAQTAGKT